MYKRKDKNLFCSFFSKNWLWILLIVLLPIVAFVVNGIVTDWCFDKYLVETVVSILAYIGTIVLGWVAFNQNKRIIKVEEDNLIYQNRPTALLVGLKQHGVSSNSPNVKTRVIHHGGATGNSGASFLELNFVNSSPFPIIMSCMAAYEVGNDQNFEFNDATNTYLQIPLMPNEECAYSIVSNNVAFFNLSAGGDKKVCFHLEVINRFGEIYSEYISIKIKKLTTKTVEYATYNYEFEKMTTDKDGKINFKSA